MATSQSPFLLDQQGLVENAWQCFSRMDLHEPSAVDATASYS